MVSFKKLKNEEGQPQEIVGKKSRKAGSILSHIVKISEVEDSPNSIILPISFFKSEFNGEIKTYDVRIYMPKFIINENYNTRNYINSKRFKVNEIIQFTDENIDTATKNYDRHMITYATQLLEVYIKDQTFSEIRNECLNMLRDAEFQSSILFTPFEGDPIIETYEGRTHHYGIVNKEKIQLNFIKYPDGTDFFYQNKFPDNLTDKLLIIQEGVDQTIKKFWNKIVKIVNDLNEKQKGYLFMNYTKSKNNDKWYLNPVKVLKSLYISVYYDKETEKRYERDQLNGKNLRSFYMTFSEKNNWKGLEWRDLRYKHDNNEYKDRIQFIFMSHPFNEYVEGNDSMISDGDRNNTFNPLIIMEDPENKDESIDKEINNVADEKELVEIEDLPF